MSLWLELLLAELLELLLALLLALLLDEALIEALTFRAASAAAAICPETWAAARIEVWLPDCTRELRLRGVHAGGGLDGFDLRRHGDGRLGALALGVGLHLGLEHRGQRACSARPRRPPPWHRPGCGLEQLDREFLLLLEVQLGRPHARAHERAVRVDALAVGAHLLAE
jgi:hypothetical protein